MLANVVGKFSGNSTYSESLSLPPELAVILTPLSGSAGNLGLFVETSVGRARFKFVLLILMATGLAVLYAAFSVIT